MGAPSGGDAFDAGAWFEGLRNHVQAGETSKRQQHEALVELRHELEIQHHEGLQEMSCAMSQFARELGRCIEAVSASAEQTEEQLLEDVASMREALDAVDSRPRQCSEMVQALQLGEEELFPGCLPPSVTVEGVECLRALVKAARADSSQQLEAISTDERATLAQMVADARRRASRLVGVVNSHVQRLEVALQRILDNKLVGEESSIRSVTFAMPPLVEAPESPMGGTSAADNEDLLGTSAVSATAPTAPALAPAPVVSSCPGTYPVTFAQTAPQPVLSYSVDEQKTVPVLPPYQDEQKTLRLVPMACSQQVPTSAMKPGGIMPQIQGLLQPLPTVKSTATMTPVCLPNMMSSIPSAAAGEPVDMNTSTALSTSTRSVPTAVRTGSMPQKGCEYYLPKAIRGVAVLIYEGDNRWRVDNTNLKSCAAGLGYRKNKHISDSTYINADQKGEVAAHWGEIVEGTDEGDGWVKCRFQAEHDVSTHYVMPGSATTTTGLLIPHALFKPQHGGAGGEAVPQGCRSMETSPRGSRTNSRERLEPAGIPENWRPEPRRQERQRLLSVGYAQQTTSPRWRVGSPAPVRTGPISMPAVAAANPGVGVLAAGGTTTTATTYAPVSSVAAVHPRSQTRPRALSPEAAATMTGASQVGGQLSRGVTAEFLLAPDAATGVLQQKSIIQQLSAAQDNLMRNISSRMQGGALIPKEEGVAVPAVSAVPVATAPASVSAAVPSTAPGPRGQARSPSPPRAPAPALPASSPYGLYSPRGASPAPSPRASSRRPRGSACEVWGV